MCAQLDFLTEKAENFRAFLLGQTPDQEMAARIEGFRSDQVWVTLTTVFLPAVSTLGKDGVVNEFMAHLSPTDKAAVRAKILRYVDCFYEVLTE
jgi:hypothetical protein